MKSGSFALARLFDSGFRPTFFTAGLAATLLVPLWIAIWGFGWSLGSSWPPTLWHAHEMLFGFVAICIAGFLLTAVPSWTGQRGFAGTPLLLLLALWLAGRVLIATSSHWPAVLVGSVDVSFLLLVSVLVAPPLLRSSNRNTPLLLLLVAFAACNGVSHWALARYDAQLVHHALVMGIDVTLMFVTVVGGRIIPAFTANALRNAGAAAKLRSWPAATPAAIIATLSVAVTDLLFLDTAISGVIAGMAAVVHAVRMLQWRGAATLRQPIVWVLHLSYAWLPVGFALKCLALTGGFAFSAFWLHALTIGALAMMIMAVMTRASLGHTGRPLLVDPAIVLAYLLLFCAALIRVFGLTVTGLPYPYVIVLSACCWTAAFGIFFAIYAPILGSPRADGKPG